MSEPMMSKFENISLI